MMSRTKKTVLIIGVTVASMVLIGAVLVAGVDSVNRSIASQAESELRAVEQAINSVSGSTISVGYVKFGLDGFGEVLNVGLIAEDTITADQIRSVLKAIQASYPDDAAYLSLSIVDAQDELIDIGDQLRKIGVDEADIVSGYQLNIRASDLQQLTL